MPLYYQKVIFICFFYRFLGAEKWTISHLNSITPIPIVQQWMKTQLYFKNTVNEMKVCKKKIKLK